MKVLELMWAWIKTIGMFLLLIIIFGIICIVYLFRWLFQGRKKADEWIGGLE